MSVSMSELELNLIIVLKCRVPIEADELLAPGSLWSYVYIHSPAIASLFLQNSGDVKESKVLGLQQYQCLVYADTLL